MKQLAILLCFLISAFTGIFAQRLQMDLSSLNWKLSLDPQASWKNDELYLPGTFRLKELPLNLPTGGWKTLDKTFKTVHLPTTVEEHFWGQNGESFGVDGNYVGVSWFSTTVNIPESMRGKRIRLQFESVRFRAEVFVNEKLCGYDLVNGTPFEVEVTDFVRIGESNRIAVRITDPNGNFNWKDSQVYDWGAYRTNPSHGFGGVTGKVFLTATDKVSIEGLFLKNRPEITLMEAEIELCNAGGQTQKGNLELTVSDKDGKVVYKTLKAIELAAGVRTIKQLLQVKSAKPWSPDAPVLYTFTANWKDSKNQDSFANQFGFRWFEVRDNKGDKQLYLNGKRIVLRTAISWGFWPVNGITPSEELATKQIEAAKKLGLNMLTFHRAIGQENVLDKADELGLLYWEEPGGNQYPADDFNPTDLQKQKQVNFYFPYRDEKLRRMMKRDRNHPSLIIYNLHNERGAAPQKRDFDELRMGHQVDPTRLLIYNSSNGYNPLDEPNDRFKTHLMPYDTTVRNFGWWDNHHAGGPGVYHDKLYEKPDRYLRWSDHKSEIVFWGEEGAIGTPPRLQLIRNEIIEKKQTGWEKDDYLKWYDTYDAFLREKGFGKAFKDVDALTTAMGNVALYYQGRIIENIRMSNTVDGYAVNGWESMKLENHSGIVDNYRNIKGDPELIARYNQPLFVAVKLNRKVLGVGDTTTVDFYLINEKNVTGKCVLKVRFADALGKVLSTAEFAVQVEGGTTFGQLLKAGWKLPVASKGYSMVSAELVQKGKPIAEGSDKLFAVQLDKQGIAEDFSVADSTGTLQKYLKAAGVKNLGNYSSGRPKGRFLLAGAFEPLQWGSIMSDLIEWIHEGNTLVVVANAERWAEFLADKEVLDYRGSKILGKSWYGGNFVVRENPLFEGLPVDCAFNWEYQCFSAYNRNRVGLRIFNGESYVGCVSDHKKEVYSALSVVPLGRGKIILTSLDITSCIKELAKYSMEVDIDGMNESMRSFNTSSDNRANKVGQQLLLNFCRFATSMP